MSAAVSSLPDEGADLVGSYRRIAGIGPPYEVIALAGPGLLRIVLVESGETATYPVSDARQDPKA